MGNLNFLIRDTQAFAEGRHHLYIELSGGQAGLWPLGYRSTDDCCLLRMSIAADGLLLEGRKLEAEAAWGRLVESVLPVFAHVDGVLQVNTNGQPTAVRVWVADAQTGEELACGVERQQGNMVSRYVESKPLEVCNNRCMLRIKPLQSSQLCLDLYAEGDNEPFAGVVLDHDPAGHVNVWRDVMQDGLFQRDLRTKLGYFQLPAGTRYTMSLALMPCGGEEYPAYLALYVVPESKQSTSFADRQKGGVGKPRIARIIMRESGGPSGQPGRYEVEQLG